MGKQNKQLPGYLVEIQERAKKEDSSRADLLMVPESPTTNTLLQILGSSGKFGTIAERADKNTNFKVTTASGGMRQITYETKHEKTVVEFPDISKVFGKGEAAKSNKTTKKVFNLVLLMIKEQLYVDGEIKGNAIKFPLGLLVDYGLYTSIRAARRGFLAGMDALTSLKVKGERKAKNGKLIAKADSMRVLFTGADIIDSECRVLIQGEFDWRLMMQYYMPLPPYSFALSNKAYDLLYYIFYVARQRAGEIGEKEFFTIKNRTLQHRLNLPDENLVKNANRDIKDVIDAAITEIEDIHNEIYKDGVLKITPMGHKDGGTIRDYLDKGYIKVEITKGWAEVYKEITEAQRKRLAKEEKKTAEQKKTKKENT